MTSPGPGKGISRRTLLHAVGLAPLAAALPAVTSTLGATPAAAASYTLESGTLTSASTGLTHAWTLTYPAGHSGEHLPVALVLHGSGQNAWTMVGGTHGGLGYPERLDALVSAGTVKPFALASIDGSVNGLDGFYEKKGGRDFGALIATDFLAFLASRGLDTTRLAIIGWSMGGWGAFRLAQHELHNRVSAIAAVSTPCYRSWKSWPSYERRDMTRSQFTANNFYGHPGLLAKPRIYLLCGKSDGFLAGNKAFARALAAAKGVRKPKTHYSAGGHSTRYWKSVIDTELRHVGRYL